MAETKMRRKGAALWRRILIAYLLSLLLTVAAVVILLMATLCSPDYFKKELKESSYAATVYSSLSDIFTSYGAGTGFGQEVMTGFLDQGQIETDMEAAVDRMYAGNVDVYEHTEVEAACYEALTADAAARGREVDADVEAALQIVAEACRTEYDSYVSIPLAGQLETLISKVNKLVWEALAVVLLLAVVCAALLFKMSGRPHTAMRCLIFSLIASAMVCALLGFVVFPQLPIRQLNINPISLRLLIYQYLKGMFGGFGWFVLLYGGAAALLALWVALARAHAKHKRVR